MRDRIGESIRRNIDGAYLTNNVISWVSGGIIQERRNPKKTKRKTKTKKVVSFLGIPFFSKKVTGGFTALITINAIKRENKRSRTNQRTNRNKTKKIVKTIVFADTSIL